MFQKRKKVKKKSLFILFSCLAVSGCLTWLTVWCNTSYPSFDYAPVEEPDYSEAKTYLMTTNALLESTLAQSIDAIITQSGTVKHYFEVWQHYVPWLEEFLNRKDVGEIVYEAYQNIKSRNAYIFCIQKQENGMKIMIGYKSSLYYWPIPTYKKR